MLLAGPVAIGKVNGVDDADHDGRQRRCVFVPEGMEVEGAADRDPGELGGAAPDGDGQQALLFGRDGGRELPGDDLNVGLKVRAEDKVRPRSGGVVEVGLAALLNRIEGGRGSCAHEAGEALPQGRDDGPVDCLFGPLVTPGVDRLRAARDRDIELGRVAPLQGEVQSEVTDRVRVDHRGREHRTGDHGAEHDA